VYKNRFVHALFYYWDFKAADFSDKNNSDCSNTVQVDHTV